jgi:hypothetical protein
VGGIPIRATSAPAVKAAVTPDVLTPNGAAHGRPGAQAMRVEHTLVELAQSGDRQANGWRADPELATQVEEALARVPLRRRRVVLGVLDGLTQRQAVINAGYRVGSPQSASQIGQQIMRDPVVQHAYQALLEARGLSGAKLDSIHALFLSRHSAVDGADRDRALRALGLARKYVVPRPPVGAKSVPDAIIDEMSREEQERFATHRVWPDRFSHRLRAAGYEPRPRDTNTPTTAVAPDDPSGDEDPADAAAPPGDVAPVPAPPPEPDGSQRPESETDAAAPPQAPLVRRPPAGDGSPSRLAPATSPEDRVWPPGAATSRAERLSAQLAEEIAALDAEDHASSPPSRVALSDDGRSAEAAPVACEIPPRWATRDRKW